MKKALPVIVLLIIVGGGSFYGGMKYADSKAAAGAAARRSGSFAQNGGGAFGNRRGGGQAGAGFVNGEVIAIDGASLTVKLRDGGSKIIFFSTSTKITETIDGTADDLKVGENISINGSANADGSVTAQNIQLRPAPSTFSGNGLN